MLGHVALTHFMVRVCVFSLMAGPSSLSAPGLLKGVEGSGVVLPRVPEDGTALVFQRHRLGFEVFVQSFLP